MMILIYNLSGFLLGLAGILIGIVGAAMTGRISVGLSILAIVWIVGGFTLRNRRDAVGVRASSPSLFFVPLQFWAFLILPVSAFIFIAENNDRHERKKPVAANQNPGDLDAKEIGPGATNPARKKGLEVQTIPHQQVDLISQELNDLRSTNRTDRNEVLSKLGQTQVVEARREAVATALREHLADSDGSDFAYWSRAAQTWMPTDKFVDCLASKLGDSKFQSQRQIIQKLGEIKTSRAAELLVPYLADERQAIFATAALSEQGEVAEPFVLTQLEHPKPDVRKHACEILAKVGGEGAKAALGKLASADPDRRVRFSADSASKEIDGRAARRQP